MAPDEGPEEIASMPELQVEKRGPVAIVTLDRSEVRNAVDDATARALAGEGRTLFLYAE